MEQRNQQRLVAQCGGQCTRREQALWARQQETCRQALVFELAHGRKNGLVLRRQRHQMAHAATFSAFALHMAQDCEVVGLGRARCKDDVFSVRADERRHARARLLDQLGRAAPG